MIRQHVIDDYRQHVADQAGYVLMHLLSDGPLDDDLHDALHLENDAGVLAWLLREMPEVLAVIHRDHRKRFVVGMYNRYWEDQAPDHSRCDPDEARLARWRRSVWFTA